MICKKCGIENVAQARFCVGCGKPLAQPVTPVAPLREDSTAGYGSGGQAEQTTYFSAPEQEVLADSRQSYPQQSYSRQAYAQPPYPAPPPMGRSKKKRLPLLLGIAGAALIVVLVLVLTLGRKTPERVAEDFFMAAISGDANALADYLPEAMLKYTFSEVNLEYYISASGVIKNVEVEAVGTQALSRAEQRKLESRLFDYYGAANEIDEAWDVDVEMSYTFFGDRVSESCTLCVYKSDGDWYVYIDW